MNDIKYAVRWLFRSPGFAAVAILSLGLGIGANTAMFSLVDALMLRPIPVHDPGSLVDLFTSSSDGDEYATTSYPDYLDIKAQNTVFSDMTAYSMMLAPLNLGDRARLVMGQIVTSNHFNMLGIGPYLGRMLQPSDDAPDAERVVVLSHRMWRSDFGSDPAVVGTTLQLRGQPYKAVVRNRLLRPARLGSGAGCIPSPRCALNNALHHRAACSHRVPSRGSLHGVPGTRVHGGSFHGGSSPEGSPATAFTGFASRGSLHGVRLTGFALRSYLHSVPRRVLATE